ncbi:amidohydrolase family protein [Streptomyces coelicoflavus]|uniref:Amidohydrolase family protein n=1 Tax=Streptomyces coelicoflavus TaxID=285562 RepID=A0A7K3PMS1_9ACTN|nr:amidohydrolase family protein [Streptomyces coelicoflavus]NEB11264.1 amidohydrolase family protein [Streptomyces coelicoflavus]
MSSEPWDGIDVVDAHAHANRALVPRLLDTMTAENVSAAFLVAGGVVSPMELSHTIVTEGPGRDVDADNTDLLDAIRDEPSLAAFCFVNPHRAVGEADLRLIDECAGVKFAPGVHGIGHLDPRVQSYVDAAAERNLPVYSHCIGNGALSVEQYAQLARRNPEVTFILGHAGRGNFDLDAAQEIRAAENVLFETSGGFDFVIKNAVETLGAERVVFGSEFPIQHPRVELTKLCLAVAEADLQAVLGGNIRRATGTYEKGGNT